MGKPVRIVDLPKGGGANRGRDVWFELVTEDGVSQELCLDFNLFSPFVAGLDRFAAEAQKLRDPTAAVGPTAFIIDGVKAEPAAEGAMILRLNAGRAGGFSFVVPSETIKPLLLQILKALSQAPAKQEAAS